MTSSMESLLKRHQRTDRLMQPLQELPLSDHLPKKGSEGGSSFGTGGGGLQIAGG